MNGKRENLKKEWKKKDREDSKDASKKYRLDSEVSRFLAAE